MGKNMRVESIDFNNYRREPIKNQDEVPKGSSIFPFLSSNYGKANRKIDDHFYQGLVGDCALLSSVYSLSLTEKGSEAIKDSIKINKNLLGITKSYDVHFAGVDETYHITQEELEEAQNYDNNDRFYSCGDDDMTLLELAMEKCFNESKDEVLRDLVDNYTSDNAVDKLNGVNPAAVTYLLTGELSENITKYSDRLAENFVAYASYIIEDEEGNERYFEQGQQYTVNSATNQYVYMENPFDADEKEVVFDTNEFKKDVFWRNNEEAVLKAEELLDNFDKNNANSMLVFATNPNQTVKDIYGNDVQLTHSTAHAFCVSDVENGIVTLINPSNTSKEIKIPQENLLSCEKFYFYNLNLVEESSNL